MLNNNIIDHFDSPFLRSILQCDCDYECNCDGCVDCWHSSHDAINNCIENIRNQLTGPTQQDTTDGSTRPGHSLQQDEYRQYAQNIHGNTDSGGHPQSATHGSIESDRIQVHVNRHPIGQNGTTNEREAPLLPTPPPSYDDYMTGKTPIGRTTQV